MKFQVTVAKNAHLFLPRFALSRNGKKGITVLDSAGLLS